MNATPEAIRRGGMPTLDGRQRKAATQRANELGAKVDAVLKELRHATKKSGWGQLTQ